MASTNQPTIPTPHLFSLEGKTAIVTGAPGGLGSEMCLAMAEMGANIVSISVANDPGLPALEKAITAVGRKVTAFECDVGDSPALRATFQKIWDAGVVPDILLNCAGVNRKYPLEEQTDEYIDFVWRVNMKGTYVAGQEFAKRLMALERPGKIINIASVLAYCAMTNSTPYATSKGGVLQMTKGFSNELAPKGIQVNCICPGYIHTPLTLIHTKQYPDLEQYITNRTPAGGWGQPADLRGTILFLSSHASDYVTGTSIVVDGGLLAR